MNSVLKARFDGSRHWPIRPLAASMWGSSLNSLHLRTAPRNTETRLNIASTGSTVVVHSQSILIVIKGIVPYKTVVCFHRSCSIAIEEIHVLFKSIWAFYDVCTYHLLLLSFIHYFINRIMCASMPNFPNNLFILVWNCHALELSS